MLTFRTLIESFDSPVPFTEWFRGSKVVNPNGTPKIVYHGTDVPVNFKSFAPGSYFTDWKEEAESYSGVLSWVQNRKDRGRVYPVYLAIKRPLYLEPYRANKLGKRLGATKEEITNTIEDYIQQGYDGIITDGDFSTMFSAFDASIPADTKHYIIFHSNQVRSAIPRQTE